MEHLQHWRLDGKQSTVPQKSYFYICREIIIFPVWGIFMLEDYLKQQYVSSKTVQNCDAIIAHVNQSERKIVSNFYKLMDSVSCKSSQRNRNKSWNKVTGKNKIEHDCWFWEGSSDELHEHLIYGLHRIHMNGGIRIHMHVLPSVCSYFHTSPGNPNPIFICFSPSLPNIINVTLLHVFVHLLQGYEHFHNTSSRGQSWAPKCCHEQTWQLLRRLFDFNWFSVCHGALDRKRPHRPAFGYVFASLRTKWMQDTHERLSLYPYAYPA